MDASLIPVVIALVTLSAALGVGWFIWGRPLKTAQGESADRREQLARALADLDSQKREVEQNRPVIARAAELERELSASVARQAERDRAYAEATALMDSRHREQMAQMQQEFQRLAAEALERAQESFVRQSGETLERHREAAAKGLDANRSALADLVNPMRETLGRYETELKAIEAKRVEAYGAMSEQLAAVAVGQHAVRAEAGKIIAALRSSSKASGAWGEAQLRNVLDMAGLREGIDFVLQSSTTDDDGKNLRPDAILRLPGGRELIIDSKCSLADYLNASEAETEADRTLALRRHAASVRTHVKSLSDKAYWKAHAASADFVILFLPGENFLAAALEHDLDLLASALDRRVLLAGPTNLLAIARVVAMVWRQEKMAEEARTVATLGAELYASLATMAEHLEAVGKNIGQTVTAYNNAIGSLEGNVLAKARRFKELGVEQGRKPIAELQPVDRAVRLVERAELKRIEGGEAANG